MPYLIYAPDTTDEKLYELPAGEISIGRERDNIIAITNETSVSRHHAQIIISQDSVNIVDRQSSNGTFVNGIKIESCLLNEGDLIHCGNAIFKFVTNANQEKDTGPKNIVKEYSQESTKTELNLLLDQQQDDSLSVLKLRQKDVNLQAVDKLKILLEVSKQLSSPAELEILLPKILDLLFEIIKVDRAVILLVNEKTGELEQKAVKGKEGITTEGRFYSKNITNFALEKGTTFLTTDASLDRRFDNAESIVSQSIHGAVCIPLKPRDKVIGVLYADNLSLSNVYSDQDVEFLTGLANQAAIAIDNTQLYKKIESEAILRNKLERFFPLTVARKLKETDKLEIVDTEVTALFSDISGFTKMSSTMEPRQIISMLNEYFKVMVEDIVFRYEGTLEKYIGDALFAIWGAPYQTYNDEEKAIKAAIDMQWAVRRLNQEREKRQQEPIAIHIGINSGKVAAGNIGSEKLIQYATIGDTTNVTSRICSEAKADEILISQTTKEKLKSDNFPLEIIPPVMVKGKDEPIQLYRLLWQQVSSELDQKI
ncbi:MAG: FHA domain-containing protein [Okeania sp. SIO3I5]|uniref:adenylate/guanylate cyclase domain-containing protein n=1 Tax=Okeania sp. SIO3I5 TaxID=2607805 RepID=UPI0013B7F090|nr:adenylate/guanylate cyclase domain-containing protein [Okeania sp. SIO3I5]NEQ37811.1 FHA domain-containing protein [Okeania sp. SIO3I5]